MPEVLEYFNPSKAGGRTHLPTLAVGFALAAIPAFCLIIPGVVLALLAMVFGSIAIRAINEREEPIAHRRAQAAVVLGFMELIVGCGLAGIVVFHA